MQESGDGGSGGGGFVRADQIDLKSLDEQLERHLNRALTMEKNKKKDEFGDCAKYEWEIDASKLTVKSVIARGTFGTVHRGIYDGQDVAGEKFDDLICCFSDSLFLGVCCFDFVFMIPRAHQLFVVISF